MDFSNHNSPQFFESNKDLKEIEIIGLFHAYIESVGDLIMSQREPVFYLDGNNLRPDFLIEINEEYVV